MSHIGVLPVHKFVFTITVDASIGHLCTLRVLQKFENNLEESSRTFYSTTPLDHQNKVPLTSQALQIGPNECYSGTRPT